MPSNNQPWWEVLREQWVAVVPTRSCPGGEQSARNSRAEIGEVQDAEKGVLRQCTSAYTVCSGTLEVGIMAQLVKWLPEIP